MHALSLPGGGTVRLMASSRAEDERELLILAQTLDDERKFRWMCSRATPDAPLLVETVVELLPRLSVGTRAGTVRFGRELLLPAYHVAMVAAPSER